MMKNRFFVILALLSAATLSGRASGTSAAVFSDDVVTTPSGRVEGVLTDSSDVMVFKGIPYAEPPIGSLRWRRTIPVKPWEGVLHADHFRDIALQTDQDKGSFYEKEFFRFGMPHSSENSLYLNIWVPRRALNNPAARMPVCMWIHGGAYQNGYSYEMEMDGDEWARRGVILVTVGYRMGITGFLCHPELAKENADGQSGNYGLYDQITALKWIHDNISAFGGDPANITVMGQSAGGGSVKNLVASPMSRSLIAKAIIESAGGLGNFLSGNDPVDYMQHTGKMLMDSLGFTTVEKMRDARSDEVRDPWSICRRQGINTMRVFAPHTGDTALPESFDNAVTDNSVADVPYLIGYTANDMMPMDEAINRFVDKRAEYSRQPVYSYEFTRRLPGDDAGAFHSSELWYTFGTLARSWRPFTPADYALSKEMLDFWTNFAKYGNPNGTARRTVWKQSTPKKHFFMKLDIKK